MAWAKLQALPVGKMMPFTYVAGICPEPGTKLPEFDPGNVAFELSMTAAFAGYLLTYSVGFKGSFKVLSKQYRGFPMHKLIL